jgi:hypothetical protein
MIRPIDLYAVFKLILSKIYKKQLSENFFKVCGENDSNLLHLISFEETILFYLVFSWGWFKEKRVISVECSR